MSAARSPVAHGRHFGLYDADAFRLTDGRGRDTPAPPQALWYFERETIAVPRPGVPVASFAKGTRAADDVRAWAATRAPDAVVDYPPLVWVGAPEVVTGAQLSADAGSCTPPGGETAPLRLAPKHPLNRSYFDASSAAYFAARTVKLRGTTEESVFVARTLWPEDFRFGPETPLPAPATGKAGAAMLRALMRAEPRGGAQSPYAASMLWQRGGGTPAPVAPGQPVIGIMVNGAQGDDDEAHGGHFALVTGRIEPDGAIGDWLVNNFYSLDIESEKGILAASVPLDNYLADLNSGQGWYRPSYMLVALLADERAATLLQSALGRVYNQFYRHQLVYQHATMNCASISVDVMRALGWDVPARGPTSRLMGALAFPYVLAKERSVTRARTACDYLIEDQTRLLPAAAFEVAGESLLALVGAGGDADSAGGAQGTLARLLAEDTASIFLLRFPQLPSNRAFGDAPAATTWEYRSRVPSDPAKVQIVPVPPRPFPAALRDPDLLPAPRRPSDVVALLWSAIVVAVVALGAWWLRRSG